MKKIFISHTKTRANWVWEKSEQELEEFLKKHPDVIRLETPHTEKKNSLLSVDKRE